MFGADKYKDNPERANAFLEVAAQKAKRRGGLRGLFSDVATLITLLKAYYQGTYRAVSWKTIAVALGAVIYFVAPLGALPDFIPFVGYIDDAVVVAWVVRRLRVEIDAFRTTFASPPAP
jgi:uncharacterized membrane protein YkvA (DUF1232 family)